MYSIEKRRISRSGDCSLGWHVGYGFVVQTMKVTFEPWCVLKDGKFFAECRGRSAAIEIRDAMNKTI